MLATTQLARVDVNAEKSMDWAISSQAPQECGEGSTTRAWSPNRTVKPHERAGSRRKHFRVIPASGNASNNPARARNSLGCFRKLTEDGIKSPSITQPVYDLIGLAEDVESIIWDISPTETPFLTMAKRTKVSQTLH